MRVAISCYEPGVTIEAKGSGFGTQWMEELLEALQTNQDKIVWLGPGHVQGTFKGDRVDKSIDVLLIIWRWPMPDYPDRQQAYYDQMKYIAQAIECKVKMVVSDQDLKLGIGDASMLHTNGAILTQPAIRPHSGFESLIFPKIKHVRTLGKKIHQRVVYIGNNYERYEIAKKYLSFKRSQNTIIGNWMVPSPHREAPEKVAEDFPTTIFEAPIANALVLDALSKYLWTIQLGKPEYMEMQMITPRFSECISAGTVAFIPQEYNLGHYFSSDVIVRSAKNVETKATANVFSDPQKFILRYLQLLDDQKNFVDTFMKIENWMRILHNV